MIKREHYLNQIIDLIDKDIIKILTGVRRSGKSVLLQQVVNHLKNNGIKEENIIFGGRLGEYKYYDMDKVKKLFGEIEDDKF